MSTFYCIALRFHKANYGRFKTLEDIPTTKVWPFPNKLFPYFLFCHKAQPSFLSHPANKRVVVWNCTLCIKEWRSSNSLKGFHMCPLQRTKQLMKRRQQDAHSQDFLSCGARSEVSSTIKHLLLHTYTGNKTILVSNFHLLTFDDDFCLVLMSQRLHINNIIPKCFDYYRKKPC